ncbi:MAG: DNA ligase [Gammaproteobacteria bacterium]|nr:DNA ligase [Gammaproteobacteria bacterium]
MKLVGKGISISLALMPLLINGTERERPEFLLAKEYQPGEKLTDFLISEKLDGVRAFWNGESLITRGGIKLNPPKWFTQNFPRMALDGELWIERGRFEELSSIVRQHQPTDEDWRKISYMVFDLPRSLKPFLARHNELSIMTDELNIPHLKTVRHYTIQSKQELQKQLDKVVANQGEGLMLHRKDSLYQARRSYDLQKLKPHYDAEAKVIKHFEGEGKYAGMLGSMLVETDSGIQFKIGSGFDVSERQNPPPVGSVITYKYFGFTNKGTPRFAVYLRRYETL